MTTDLAVLTRVLPPAALEEADGLLDERQLAKFALMAAELENLTSHSELLAGIPADRAACHRLSEAIVVAVKACKELDALRRSRVDPLNAEVRRVNALIARLTDPLEAFRRKGDPLLVAGNRAEAARVERERLENIRKQEEAAKKEGEALAKAEAAKTPKAREKALAEADVAARVQAEASVAVPEVAPRAYRGDVGTVQMRKRWVAEIVKPALLPRQYLIPDESAIRKAVAAEIARTPEADRPDVVARWAAFGVAVIEQESTAVGAGR